MLPVVIIITFAVTFIGTDHTWQEITGDSIILRKLLLNFFTVLVGWLGVKQIVKYFDRKMPWSTTDHKKRWLRQVGVGIIFILLLFFAELAIRTLIIPDWKFIASTFWTVDLPLAVIFGLSFNPLYYFLWYRDQNNSRDAALEKLKAQKASATASSKTIITVLKGRKKVRLAPESIAFIYRENELNQLVTFEAESYHLDDSINAVEALLNPDIFFRINRQLLAHREAITSFQTLSNRQLSIELSPKIKDPFLMNKNKVAQFKKWLKSQ